MYAQIANGLLRKMDHVGMNQLTTHSFPNAINGTNLFHFI